MLRKTSTLLLLLLASFFTTHAQEYFNRAYGAGSYQTDEANFMAVDKSGNSYVCGTFTDSIDLAPGKRLKTLNSGTVQRFLAAYTKNGTLRWAHLYDVSVSALWVITFDRSGDLLLSGQYVGTADLDPGPNVLTLPNAYYDRAFIARLDTGGHFKWAKGFGGYDGSAGFDIKTDAANNIYFTGAFLGTVYTGRQNLFSQGRADIFLAKYDANGNILWGKGIGGSGYDAGRCLHLDDSGHVYLGGAFEGIVDMDPGTGKTEISSQSGGDLFLSRYDTAGNFNWAIDMLYGGSYSSDWMENMILGKDGNLYVAGHLQGSADFDPSPAVNKQSAVSIAALSPYMASFTYNGKLNWAKTIKVFDCDVNGFTMDDSLNLYLTGTYSGGASDQIDFDPDPTDTLIINRRGASNMYIGKYNSLGELKWVMNIGGSGMEEGRAIGLDAQRNIYVAGHFYGSSDMDPGKDSTIITGRGGWDMFIARYTIKPLPGLKFNMTTQAYVGDTLKLKSSSNNNSGSYHYSILPGGTARAILLKNDSLALNRAGKLTLRVRQDENMDFEADSSTITLTVNKRKPVLSIILVKDSLMVGDTMHLSFKSNSPGAVKFTTGSGSGGGIISGSRFTATSAGSIGIFATQDSTYMYDLASISKTIYIRQNTGITLSIQPAGALQFYPNPAKSTFHIQSLEGNRQNYSLILRSMDGKLIQSWNGQNAENEFSLKDIPDGLYLVELRRQDGIYIGKLIIE